MLNWKDALETSQTAMKKSRWQIFINNQPKVMKTIIANEGVERNTEQLDPNQVVVTIRSQILVGGKKNGDSSGRV